MFHYFCVYYGWLILWLIQQERPWDFDLVVFMWNDPSSYRLMYCLSVYGIPGRRSLDHETTVPKPLAATSRMDLPPSLKSGSVLAQIAKAACSCISVFKTTAKNSKIKSYKVF